MMSSASFTRARFFTVAFALAAAPLAVAQPTTGSEKRETVAALRDVQGNVLVSDKNGMASASAGQRIGSGVRVTTTAKASALIAFDSGCMVQLKENERIDVESPRSCAELLAAVTSAAPALVIGAPVATATATSSYVAPLVGGAAGVGGYLLYRNNRNSSPN